MKRLIALIVVGVTLGFGWASFAGAESLGFYQQGDLNLNGPSYGWWYGCTPTSAGMMMGYYDQKGYGGLYYSSLVPGGVAEANTVYHDAAWNALVKPVIASQGYANDYYRKNGVADNNAGFTAVGKFNDDVDNPGRAANCLADYMGSGQDWVASKGEKNPNGTTWIYYWPSGAKFYASHAATGGLMVLRNGVYESMDGMLGMDLYLRSCGYGTGDITQDTSFFTQLIQGKGDDPNQGFTFANYQAEIDAGRVVMIQVEGHSMFGYGYTTDGKIIFDNTWNGHDLTMTWGGYYGSMEQWGVTCFTPSGGQVPLPSSLLLMISGLAGLVGWRVRFRQK